MRRTLYVCVCEREVNSIFARERKVLRWRLRDGVSGLLRDG